MFNAEISAGIQESLADADYGQLLAGRGIATVALTEDGQMVEHPRRHLGPGDGPPVKRTKRRVNAPATL